MSGLTGNNILGGSSGQSTGYDIEKSVVLDTNSYFTRTPSSAGNRKTYTLSFWAKLSQGSNGIGFGQYSDSNNRVYFRVQPAGFSVYSVSGGSADCDVSSPVVFRDPSAWYHIVIVVDTTESTASNRIKLWVNGSSITLTHTTSWTQNTDTRINDTNEHTLGLYNNTAYPDGYLAEVNFIDGQALTPASFGETDADTNQWKAIEYEGSYGTNGFYLDFATRATDPIDASGNGNNWSSTNVIAGDWKIDSPTNNFATVNPLVKSTNTFSEGNLKVTASTSAGSKWASTIGVSSGKWYAEFITPASNFVIGITADNTERDYLGNSDGNTSIAWWPVTSATNLFINGSNTAWAGNTTTWANGDIVGLALNADDEEISIYKNGTLISPAVSYSSYNWTQAFFAGGNYASGLVYYTNFGQDSSFAGQKTAQGNGGVGEDFYYTPPTGYKALNTNNLDNPSIDDPTKHFNTVLYTGNGTAIGSGGLTVTGTGFQPDFTWVKQRNTTRSHNLYNSVVGVTKRVESNNSDTEATDAESLTSWNSDGFVVGNRNSVNGSSDTYASWNWKAGGTASSNSDGTITSSVNANPTAGFSIVSYTGNATAGATVGHGLSQAPEMLIVKQRDATKNWAVLAIDPTDYLILNSNNTTADDIGFWNDTAPSSSVFTLGNIDWVNNNTSTYIAYCFHSIEGYSKVGGYTGNGNADGTFVYTGFRPAFILWKSTSAGENWQIQDNKINPYNVVDGKIFANLSSAEYTGAEVDFVSNGFKLRHSGGGGNGSSETLVYLAFAESPFKYSNAR